MSYVDELNKIEQEGKKKRANKKSYIDLAVERIIECVKKETARIAFQESVRSHHAEGFAYSDESEGIWGLGKRGDYLSVNYASPLNKGVLSIEDLEVICQKARDELYGMKFKKVSVEIVKEDLSDLELHPANVERCGYSEAKGISLKRKGVPKKYLVYVSVDW